MAENNVVKFEIVERIGALDPKGEEQAETG